MTIRSIWALLFVIGASQAALTQNVAGQSGPGRDRVAPASRPRMSDDELLRGRPVAASVDELRGILQPGHEVVLWDAEGRRTRGLLSSIAGDQVVIHRRASSPLLCLFVRPKDRAFPAESLTRIDIVDSTWNGALIGAAIAPALVFGIYRWEETAVSDSNSTKGLATVVFGGISTVLAIAVGQQIDLSMNQPIYQRQRGRPQLTLAPWLESNGKGVLARVRF